MVRWRVVGGVLARSRRIVARVLVVVSLVVSLVAHCGQAMALLVVLHVVAWWQAWAHVVARAICTTFRCWSCWSCWSWSWVNTAQHGTAKPKSKSLKDQ